MTITEAVVAVLVVSICVGLPIFGLTLRFALKPLLDAYLTARATGSAKEGEVDALKVRVAALEAVWDHRLGAGTLDSVLPLEIRERSRS